jgi:kynurenine formamidase
MAVPDWFAALAKQVNNWGRWGSDDELGTLNLITPEAVTRAAACVRTGRTFSLALPLSEAEGIQLGFVPGRVNPLRSMVSLNSPLSDDADGVCTNDDIVVMALQAATHWDALAHVSYRGLIYNGYPASSVTARGASRCGIGRVRTLVSRGVLLDVARARGAERLDEGYRIVAEDLDAARELAGVEIESGDVVLVRTGQMQHLRGDRPDKLSYAARTPGLSTACVPWFHDHDVAAVATDTMVFECWPPEDPQFMLPVHLLHLVEMGLTQGQNFQLEDLAADCAADGVYECLLEASPQPFTGGVGSPVNPVAIK